MNLNVDITFCGDWAGNSYKTTKCPGTCEERLQDPQNFEVCETDWNVYREADVRVECDLDHQ